MKKNRLGIFTGRIIFTLQIMFYFSANIFGQQLAFPGAEGYGRFTTGGRGGKVFKVTNLNDSGKGSLREAVKASGARTIVFDISGTIFLESPLSIKNGDITIAGQTAPGDGICIAGFTTSIEADNVIVRYLRFRLGDINRVADDSFKGIGHKDIIIDHCSFTWAVDECASFYDNKNFTMQWCIIGESLNSSVHPKGDHGYGGIQGGLGATFHHNLYVNNSSRNPRFSGSRNHLETASEEIVDFVNNVIYNWGINSVYGGELGNYNVRGNYYKHGPATQLKKRNRILNPTESQNPIAGYGKFYVEDNFVYEFPNTTHDNWETGVQEVSSEVKKQIKAVNPFSIAEVKTHSAIEAYELVLNNAGAVLPKRDSVDARLVLQVRANNSSKTSTDKKESSGIINSQKDVGGWPLLRSQNPLEDADNDGMPDNWEIKHSLNPNDPSDSFLFGKGGYTNLEKYLNTIE